MITLAVVSKPAHSTMSGTSATRRRRIKEGDVDAERHVEHPEPRQQQAGGDADDGR